VDDVATAYDEVSKDISQGDVVVVLGSVPEDMGSLVLRLRELLA
jgi:fructose-1-phosphate kinase PfkB-like protein